VAVGITTHGYRKPDINELAKTGGTDIAFNAQKADDHRTDSLAAQAALAARLGVAEANIKGGLGTDIGLSEDPLAPGTYFMADTSPIQPDPANPGLYTF
jgi:hypothetical protein